MKHFPARTPLPRSLLIPLVLPTLLLATASLLAARPALAIDPALTIEEVRVKALRSPVSAAEVISALSVVDGTTLRARPQQGLDESLNAVPGLFFQNRYNYAQDLRIAIRGFGARARFGIRGVRLVVDGIPTTLPDGQGSVDSLELSSIERIEVIRGTTASLYGNASGGIILIESEVGAEQPYLESRIAYGGDGFRKAQLKSAGSSGDIDYLFSLVDLHSDGYRDHSEARNALFNGRVRWHIDPKTQLDVVFNRTDQPRAEDPGGVSAEVVRADRRAARDTNVDLNAGEALDQNRLGLRLRKQIGAGELTVGNYYLWRNFAGRLPLGGNGINNFERQVRGINLAYSQPIASSELRVTAGLDFAEQDDDRERFQNNAGLPGNKVLDQHETVRNTGLFLQALWQPSNHWQFNAGVRYDEVKFIVDDRFDENSGRRTLNETSPELGAILKLSDNQQLFARLSTAFETPTTTELAEQDQTGLNKDLQPQLARSAELGWRGSFGEDDTGRYSATLFNIDIKDEIIAGQDSGGADIFVNAGESSRQGIELSLQLDITEQLSASAAYSFSEFEFDRFKNEDGSENYAGNALPGAPRHVSYLQLDYQQHADSDKGWFASFDTLYVDDFALDNGNTVFSDRYTLSNLRLAWRLIAGNWVIEPFAGVNNLFNREYIANHRLNAFGGRFFEAGPDRSPYGGLTLRLQSPD